MDRIAQPDREDLHRLLYPHLESLCVLEATAALLCHNVLESNELVLTEDERDGLVVIMTDEARHYKEAKAALRGLMIFDQKALSRKLREYREEHLRRWAGPVGRIARLHGDELLISKNIQRFRDTLTGLIPEEGAVFVKSVETDEPRHVLWGKSITQRLSEDSDELAKFIRINKRAEGWPAANIMRGFREVQKKMGIA